MYDSRLQGSTLQLVLSVRGCIFGSHRTLRAKRENLNICHKYILIILFLASTNNGDIRFAVMSFSL